MQHVPTAAGHDPRYDTLEWRRLRLVVIDRDLGLCQMRGPNCTRFATAVDHIIPVADGGMFWQTSNLRAACRTCNSAAGAELTNSRRASRFEYHTRM